MVVFYCFNYHCWLKLFLERSWSVILPPSILPTVNNVRQTLCSYPGLVFCGHDLSCHLYHMLLEACLTLQSSSKFFCSLSVLSWLFNFFPYLSILFKENFLLWFLCFAMGTFILTSSLILPDFLEWTGAIHLGSVLSSQRCFACCYLPFYLFFREQFLSFYFW